MSYSKKLRQLQEEKEARLNKTPEKETRSVIKQSGGGVTATAPSRDLTDNKKKRREGSSKG